MGPKEQETMLANILFSLREFWDIQDSTYGVDTCTP